jgi:hypothetical protein
MAMQRVNRRRAAPRRQAGIGRAHVIVALTVAGWLVVAGFFFFGHHIMEVAASVADRCDKVIQLRRYSPIMARKASTMPITTAHPITTSPTRI